MAELCKNGHELTPDNIVKAHGGRYSYCRTCKNDRNRAYMRRRYGIPEDVPLYASIRKDNCGTCGAERFTGSTGRRYCKACLSRRNKESWAKRKTDLEPVLKARRVWKRHREKEIHDVTRYYDAWERYARSKDRNITTTSLEKRRAQERKLRQGYEWVISPNGRRWLRKPKFPCGHERENNTQHNGTCRICALNSDAYVINFLINREGWDPQDITPELIETRKLLLQLRREVRNVKRS